MEYISVKEAAEKWGTTARSVQKYCTEGRIEGAVKISGIWAVPENAEKPADMRKITVKNTSRRSENKKKQAEESTPVKKAEAEAGRSFRTVMPLMNTPYEPGSALASVNKIEDGDMRNIALAEYYYFSGHPSKASDIAEPYLVDSDLALQLSACLIYAYSNLALDRIPRAKQAIKQIRAAADETEGSNPRCKSFAACIAAAACVLLHLPLPEGIDSIKSAVPMLPTGIRLFALYIEAHGYYLGKRYDTCIAVAETALALEEKLYPIPSIYLHLAAAMGYINIKEPEQAKNHLLEAWKIAQPDDMIEAFGEHHGLLGGLLEVVMKKDYPNDFKRIINITYSFSSGWRKVHNPVTGHYVADDLTTTEFTVAMLAARNWSNKEIAAHLQVSAHTVKKQVDSVLQKLGNLRRVDLPKYMLK